MLFNTTKYYQVSYCKLLSSRKCSKTLPPPNIVRTRRSCLPKFLWCAWNTYYTSSIKQTVLLVFFQCVSTRCTIFAAVFVFVVIVFVMFVAAVFVCACCCCCFFVAVTPPPPTLRLPVSHRRHRRKHLRHPVTRKAYRRRSRRRHCRIHRPLQPINKQSGQQHTRHVHMTCNGFSVKDGGKAGIVAIGKQSSKQQS